MLSRAEIRFLTGDTSAPELPFCERVLTNCRFLPSLVINGQRQKSTFSFMLLQTKTLEVLALRTVEVVQLKTTAPGICVGEVRDKS